jgi:Ni/Co efflux regulator RcnB
VATAKEEKRQVVAGGSRQLVRIRSPTSKKKGRGEGKGKGGKIVIKKARWQRGDFVAPEERNIYS